MMVRVLMILVEGFSHSSWRIAWDREESLLMKVAEEVLREFPFSMRECIYSKELTFTFLSSGICTLPSTSSSTFSDFNLGGLLSSSDLVSASRSLTDSL